MRHCKLYVDATPKSTAFVRDDGQMYYESAVLTNKLTVNESEYQALIVGLRHCLSEGITCILIYSDSEIVVKQVQGHYKTRRNLISYHDEVMELLKQFEAWSIAHIKGTDNPADWYSREVLKA